MHPDGHAEGRRQAGSRSRWKAKVPTRDTVHNSSVGQFCWGSRIDRCECQFPSRQESLAGRYVQCQCGRYKVSTSTADTLTHSPHRPSLSLLLLQITKSWTRWDSVNQKCWRRPTCGPKANLQIWIPRCGSFVPWVNFTTGNWWPPSAGPNKFQVNIEFRPCRSRPGDAGPIPCGVQPCGSNPDFDVSVYNGKNISPSFVTGFLEMPLNDQMRLLQTSWPEVLSLSLAFRSIPLNATNPKLQWSADFSMNEKEARECGMEELFFQVRAFNQTTQSYLYRIARTLNPPKYYRFEQCVQVAQRLEQLSVTREEYYLLKALVLVNCDVRVESMAHVKKLRETVLSALSDCSTALRYKYFQYSTPVDKMNHFFPLQTGQRCQPANAAFATLHALHPASGQLFAEVLGSSASWLTSSHEQALFGDARIAHEMNIFLFAFLFWFLRPVVWFCFYVQYEDGWVDSINTRSERGNPYRLLLFSLSLFIFRLSRLSSSFFA